MEKELIHMPMEHIITVNGSMTNSMDMVWSHGQMVLNTKENTLMERKKVKVSLLLLMEVFIKENSNQMRFVDMENTLGLMERNTKDSGLIIRCMDKVS